MSSTVRAPHTAPETAARIRDAAISAFAAQGFTRATVRGIATTAGVSPGLVIHHFGSKAGLRTACDDFVFKALIEKKQEKATTNPLLVAEIFQDDSTRTTAEYLLMSLLDPSDQGQRFFDHYVESVERVIEDGFAGFTLRQSKDRRAQAATIAMLGLAPLMLERRIRPVIGTDNLSESFNRISPHLFDLYLRGVIESVPDGFNAAVSRNSRDGDDSEVSRDSRHDLPESQVTHPLPDTSGSAEST